MVDVVGCDIAVGAGSSTGVGNVGEGDGGFGSSELLERFSSSVIFLHVSNNTEGASSEWIDLPNSSSSNRYFAFLRWPSVHVDAMLRLIHR